MNGHEFQRSSTNPQSPISFGPREVETLLHWAVHTEKKHAPGIQTPATLAPRAYEIQNLKPETWNLKTNFSSKSLATDSLICPPHPEKTSPNPAKPHTPEGESRTTTKAWWMSRESRVESREKAPVAL